MSAELDQLIKKYVTPQGEARPRMRRALARFGKDMDSEVCATLEGVVLYLSLREEGKSHRWADMCASRRGPGTFGSERAFFQGACNGNQFEKCPALGDYRRVVAESMSPGCTKGAIYDYQVARFPGDPMGWIKDMHEGRQKLKARNMTLEGPNGFKGHQVEPQEGPALSESIINNRMILAQMEDPSLCEPKKQKRLREDIVNKHCPAWRKHLLKG